MIVNEPRRGMGLKKLRLKKLPDNAPSIIIGVPCRDPKLEWGRWSPEFCLFLRQLAQPMNYSMNVEVEWAGVLPAENREIITHRALEANARYLVFFDDDILMPRDTLHRFMTGMEKMPNAAIISGLCCKKSKELEPEVFKAPNQGRYWHYQKETVQQVWVTGAGCMAINLDYVRQMKQPYWIDEVVEYKNEIARYGQDINFCRKLQEQTYGKVYLDTNIVCGHMDIKTGVIYWPEFMPDQQKEFDTEVKVVGGIQ